MVAHGYNGATSLTQHLNFPQQPSLLPQPWATAGLAATAAGAQPGASSGACTEQLFRMDGAGSLYRQMPPGLEASLATAAEWSSANAWDASSAPSWLILSACSRSSREAHGTHAQYSSSALSPLAQRAADAAVRVAAGLLSPGRWKAPQAVGVSSMAALHNSASLPKNFAPYKSTYKPISPVQVPLSRSISNGSDEYGRPKKSSGKVQPGTSGTLEGSITALADALSSLEAGPPCDKARRLDFGSIHQSDALDFQAEAMELQPGSPDSGSSGSGHGIRCCSPGSMAGGELMDEAFLDSTSTHSGVLEAAEPTEEWLSTGSDLTTTTDGDLPLSSAILEQAESSTASELDDGSLLHEDQAIGSMEELGFLEANAPLQSLPELPLEEDAAVCSEVMSADLASEQQRLWPCSTPVQNRLALDLNVGEEPLRSYAQPDGLAPAQLPSFAPRRPGRALETPFAESCAESPFEAPSPRDMQLSPAEEQLIPASGLSSPKEPNVEQILVHPRSPVLTDRSKTEQILWKPDALPAKHALQRSRSAGSCAAEAKACRPGKRLFGIVAEDQSEWQPLVRESSQVMEMVGLDTEWMLNDLLACADAAYA
ncbi:g160 [Coccomyxa viridis]|uniref:G160 protein n=1 Tax=Coccomyxa viridis TaxID=1274662 RepID=A0ABP1FIQ1_9CHLO